MKIIDISVLLDNRLPIWPSSDNPKIERVLSMSKGNKINETKINVSVHTGTHIDAPLHFVRDGNSINDIPNDIFVGRVFVAEIKNIKKITAKEIKRLNIPKDINRILFKTSNSELWKTSSFCKDYVGLDISGAKWLVENNIKLVGVDYLSVAKFDETEEVHKILLNKNTVLLEGIDLSKVKSGEYQLICLPLKVKNAEASLTRAILIKI